MKSWIEFVDTRPTAPRARVLAMSAAVGAALIASAARAQCTHYAGDAARRAQAAFAPAAFATPWQTPPLTDDVDIEPFATPLYLAGRLWHWTHVFEGSLLVAAQLTPVAISRTAPADAVLFPPAFVDSWSSPAIDAQRGMIYAAAGDELAGIDPDQPARNWRLRLSNPVVNASPAISSGLAFDRVFITDFSPGGAGALYAVNLDAYDAIRNPYTPGELVWSATLGGTSGNTPAFADGAVYCADIDGRVHAFDAATGAPRWSRPVAGGPSGGFFGGITVSGDALYAATYYFYDGQDNSRLCKLRCSTGEVIWSIACERTSSTPVVTDNGHIYLSGGIDGFGSAVKVQAFADRGTHAEQLWDTHRDTAGGLRLGGWQHQPLFVPAAFEEDHGMSTGRLIVGAPDLSAVYPRYIRLVALNLERNPSQPGFVQAEHLGHGGSPALVGGRLVTAGADRFALFEATRPGDTNCDGAINFADIESFVLALVSEDAYYAAQPLCAHDWADTDRNGVVDFGDIDPFVQALIDG